MHSIIFSNQSAFILEKLILDNIMVAHELLHTLKSHKRGRVGHVAMKLDLSNANDRMEWPYLQAAMGGLGFNQKWIQLIMSYVSTVSYLVFVNGKPNLHFIPIRRLR